MRKLIIITLMLLSSNISFGKEDSVSIHKGHSIGTNLYYNKHNQYFTNGFMFDINYEYTFNRWFGLSTSFGFNRASVNLNNWKEDYLNDVFKNKAPSLTSSILLNIKGNFYCINKIKHRLRLSLAIEYRNITDVISVGVLNFSSSQTNPNAIITQTGFEQYNDLGISSDISYEYVFKKGIGINTSFGYNHYFTYLSKRAYDRSTNTGYRNGGSSFLKAGIGISYQF